MSLWGENSVLNAMTSVAFGEWPDCIEGKSERSLSVAPVLPEIKFSLPHMKTKSTGSGDGSSDRTNGHEPSIHRLTVFLKSDAADLGANAGRGL
ncbi:hypothetical protein H6M51_13675 [Rhizobium sp. AQ_MP]|uniref:hypothetical protein n=1 Tax=Rhizobium sp. AQ_MP TaxID=2761536 RepID=UPI001639F2BB|nr:hypothetical protein [Rhizobium sp. AQ_MP]MBC2773910.1 hypothetical protein [Rhizobium sp. AQ_MP]